jgi:hypothetical protein
MKIVFDLKNHKQPSLAPFSPFTPLTKKYQKWLKRKRNKKQFLTLRRNLPQDGALDSNNYRFLLAQLYLQNSKFNQSL